jgi:hypothetical protein
MAKKKKSQAWATSSGISTINMSGGRKGGISLGIKKVKKSKGNKNWGKW